MIRLPRDTRIGKTEDLLALKIVEVEWRDACSNAQWRSFEDVRDDEPALCKSVGRLTKNTKNVIQVAGSVNSMGGVGDTTTIPKAWVRRIRFLA